MYAYGYIGLRIYTPTDIYAYIHVYIRYLYILTDTYKTGIYIFNNYSLEYPDWLEELECFNLLMAIRLWADEWRGRHILLYCDNWATVCSASSGRAEEPLIRSSLREFWWLGALHDLHLEIRHRPGAEMEIADLLSRANTSKAYNDRFIKKFISTSSEHQLFPRADILLPPINI